MFEHKGVHQCTWHQDTLGRRSMIDFVVVVSSDLRPYVLDTRFEVVDARSLVPVVAATPRTRWWTPGCKGCRQAEEGVLSDHVGLWDSWTQLTGTGRPRQAAARTVLEAKTRVWEEFGGELLTSTGDIVGRWKKYFEDLLNPTDLPSNEEAEAGVSEVDSSITQAEVTEPPREGLRQGTGEENSADSRTLGFRRNNAVFVLVVEHWTSSIPPQGA
ncbi:hypothetical protein L3Q82_024015 [Scortum barcoo]|uniref:Uncharacterized protein n=1 Tax=Scortum barcoo TaxID=214431 RepID=A0ACB8WU92_9TELE|nr:hypothetical protein L3Q82_024015 [Scortum barcoo]